ncbi:hypothetical protein Cgig2_026811 [Carnegiea gigantea]|uniref:Uncharacterized protein n=1 Tax=Carnegiea gigantea TaxID=171969 RepID=A0A9Q1JY90_9CARY|nr:hypothetical protein Cgig2_026811 [Carnegiea gigantea]
MRARVLMAGEISMVPDMKSGTERIDAVVIDEEAVESADETRVVAKILRGECGLEHFLRELKSTGQMMESTPKALLKSQALKEEGNKLCRTKAYRSALNRYEKSIQYLFVVVPGSENEAYEMVELAIAVNLNIAACWLKLKEFELAKRQYDVVMNLDLFNVKARFRRAQALVNLGLKAEALQDLLVALSFDPNNEEIKQELRRIEEMCNVSNEKDLVKEVEVNGNNSVESSSKQVGQLAFDPIKLQVSSVYDKISGKTSSLGPGDPIAKTGKV